MAHAVLLWHLLHAAVLLGHCAPVAVAVVYIVGGPAGWDFAPTASYYSDWASENTFVPGDTLSFRYDPADHNVQQVNLSDYATCNTLSPIQQYQSGHDLITFQHPGTYCFICGFAGHCEGGGMLLKLVVTTGSAATLQPPPAPNHPPPPRLNPPPNRGPPLPGLVNPPPKHPPPPGRLKRPPNYSPPSPNPRPPPVQPIREPSRQPFPPARRPPGNAAQGHPGAPAPQVAGPPESPLRSPPPPPPVFASPPPRQSHSHPVFHPKPSRRPRNQTYESPAAPPAKTAAPAPAPAPMDFAPAPSPSDDFDTGKMGRQVSPEVGFTCLVVAAGVFLFW